MITLYTAVGRYQVKTAKNGMNYPFIIKSSKEFLLDRHEMLLWSCLAWSILSYEELQAEFYKKEQEYHMLTDLGFDHYLKRMVFRGLIVSGSDYTGIDSLYNLISHLYILPCRGNLALKMVSFFRLIFRKHLPIKKAFRVFTRQTLSKKEKDILRLANQQVLSFAELITCIESGHTKLKNHSELMNCLYSNEDVNCNNIAIQGRFLNSQPEILVTIANLYFRKLILFDTL